MNELFKRLVDSNLLTEDVKKELEAEYQTMLEESIKVAQEKAAADVEVKVRAELTEAFLADKEALIEALDTKAEERLTKEITELKEDIENFRDLEAEYAEKLVAARKEMADTVKKDMESLVERVSDFLEERMKEEIIELKESIEEVKKSEFGRRIYEAVVEEFKSNFTPDSDSVEAKLTETTSELAKVKQALQESADVLATLQREKALNTVLESLQGRPREIMAVILDKVSTDKLNETYKKFIGRVLHESAAQKVVKVEDVTNSEKDNTSSVSVLAEGNNSTGDSGTTVVTGDLPVQNDLIDEHSTDTTVSRLDESKKAYIKRLAGIN